jgi:hypothetical protein
MSKARTNAEIKATRFAELADVARPRWTPRRHGLRDIATLLNPRNERVRNGMRFLGLAPSARFCANKAHSVTHIHITRSCAPFGRLSPLLAVACRRRALLF